MAKRRGKQRGPKENIPMDEVDEFHEEQDKIPLKIDDAEDDDEDNLLDQVDEELDLDIGSSSDSDEYDENWKNINEQADEERYQEEKARLVAQEEVEAKQWKKHEFHGADTSMYEVASDQEDAEEEEEAAIALQQEQAEQIEGEYEGMLEDLLASGATVKTKTTDVGDAAVASKLHSELNSISFLDTTESGTQVETVKRDLSKLSKGEKLEILQTEAPELPELLNELQDTLKLLAKKTSGEKGEEERAYRLASRCYAVNLAFYLLLKNSRSQEVREHPVMGRLIHFGQLVETLREARDEARSRKQKASEQRDSNDLDNKETLKKKKKKKKRKKRKKDHSEKTDTAPVKVVKGDNALTGNEVSPKAANEDDYFLQLSEGNRTARKKRAVESDDYGDEKGEDSSLPSAALRIAREREANKLQQYNNDGKRNAAGFDFGDFGMDEDEDEDEDELHDEQEVEGMEKVISIGAKASKASTKKGNKVNGEVKKKPRGILLNPENPDKIHADGRRKANKRIIKNRGLTRVRNKKYRTPHLRARHKFEKAMKRRRDQIRDFQGSKAARYLGEKTGIKAHTIKSRKLKP